MIIDSHSHITIDKTAIFKNYDIKRLTEEMNQNGVDYAISFINPFVKELLCPVDSKHKIQILDGYRDNELMIYCTICKKIIYKGKDPLRRYNEKFLKICKKDNRIIPFVFLSMSKNTINHEIDFFEENYKNSFVGFKIHPTINMRACDSIGIINSSRPLIIHSGVESYANPNHCLELAKYYNGNISVAHCGRFNKKFFDNLKNYQNVFIDTSPIIFLYNLYKKKPNRLYGIFSLIKNEEDLVNYLLTNVNITRILFASDTPFGSLKDEVNFFKNIIIDEKDKIVYKNCINFLWGYFSIDN